MLAVPGALYGSGGAIARPPSGALAAATFVSRSAWSYDARLHAPAFASQRAFEGHALKPKSLVRLSAAVRAGAVRFEAPPDEVGCGSHIPLVRDGINTGGINAVSVCALMPAGTCLRRNPPLDTTKALASNTNGESSSPGATSTQQVAWVSQGANRGLAVRVLAESPSHALLTYNHYKMHSAEEWQWKQRKGVAQAHGESKWRAVTAERVDRNELSADAATTALAATTAASLGGLGDAGGLVAVVDAAPMASNLHLGEGGRGSVESRSGAALLLRLLHAAGGGVGNSDVTLDATTALVARQAGVAQLSARAACHVADGGEGGADARWEGDARRWIGTLLRASGRQVRNQAAPALIGLDGGAFAHTFAPHWANALPADTVALVVVSHPARWAADLLAHGWCESANEALALWATLTATTLAAAARFRHRVVLAEAIASNPSEALAQSIAALETFGVAACGGMLAPSRSEITFIAGASAAIGSTDSSTAVASETAPAKDALAMYALLHEASVRASDSMLLSTDIVAAAAEHARLAGLSAGLGSDLPVSQQRLSRHICGGFGAGTRDQLTPAHSGSLARPAPPIDSGKGDLQLYAKAVPRGFRCSGKPLAVPGGPDELPSAGPGTCAALCDAARADAGGDLGACAHFVHAGFGRACLLFSAAECTSVMPGTGGLTTFSLRGAATPADYAEGYLPSVSAARRALSDAEAEAALRYTEVDSAAAQFDHSAPSSSLTPQRRSYARRFRAVAADDNVPITPRIAATDADADAGKIGDVVSSTMDANRAALFVPTPEALPCPNGSGAFAGGPSVLVAVMSTSRPSSAAARAAIRATWGDAARLASYACASDAAGNADNGDGGEAFSGGTARVAFVVSDRALQRSPALRREAADHGDIVGVRVEDFGSGVASASAGVDLLACADAASANASASLFCPRTVLDHDSYLHLPYKVAAMLRLFATAEAFAAFDFVLKFDEDGVVNLPAVLRLASTLDPRLTYAGSFVDAAPVPTDGRWADPQAAAQSRTYPPYALGSRGYLLGRGVVVHAAARLDAIARRSGASMTAAPVLSRVNEDAMVGALLAPVLGRVAVRLADRESAVSASATAASQRLRVSVPVVPRFVGRAADSPAAALQRLREHPDLRDVLTVTQLKTPEQMAEAFVLVAAATNLEPPQDIARAAPVATAAARVAIAGAEDAADRARAALYGRRWKGLLGEQQAPAFAMQLQRSASAGSQGGAEMASRAVAISEAPDAPTIAMLGFHHSGTSIATRLTMALGAWGGDLEDFELSASNPRMKFWERSDVVEANQELLEYAAARGAAAVVAGNATAPPVPLASWLGYGFEPFGEDHSIFPLPPAITALFERRVAAAVGDLVQGARGGPSVVKDPRLCLALPLWRPVLPALQCVIVYRHPAELVRSMMGLGDVMDDVGGAVSRALASHGAATQPRMESNAGAGVLAAPYGAYGRAVKTMAVSRAAGGRGGVRRAASDPAVRGALATAVMEVIERYLVSALEACRGAPTAVVPFDALRDPLGFAERLRTALVEAWPSAADALVTPSADEVGEALFGPQGWQQRRASAVADGDVRPVLELGDPTRGVHSGAPAAAEIELSLGLKRLAAAFEAALDREDKTSTQAAVPPMSLAAHVLSAARRGGALEALLFWTTAADSWGLQERRVLESVFFHHPDAQVTVFTNTLPLDFFARFAAAGYAVEVERYDLEATLARHWPADFDFFGQGAGGDFFYSHATDALRYALLYERGGVYLDTDVVLVNPLDNLPERWVAYQYSAKYPPKRSNWAVTLFDARNPNTWVTNGALMAFPKEDPFLAACLAAIPKVWDPDVWYSIGPQLITNLLLDRQAGTRRARWAGVEILPMERAAPVPWHLAAGCTRRQAGCPVGWAEVRQTALAFHLYNKITAAMPAEPGSLYHQLLSAFRLRDMED